MKSDRGLNHFPIYMYCEVKETYLVGRSSNRFYIESPSLVVLAVLADSSSANQLRAEEHEEDLCREAIRA